MEETRNLVDEEISEIQKEVLISVMAHESQEPDGEKKGSKNETSNVF